MKSTLNVALLFSVILICTSCSTRSAGDITSPTYNRITAMVDMTDSNNIAFAFSYFKEDSLGQSAILRLAEEAGFYQYGPGIGNCMSVGFLSDLGQEPQKEVKHDALRHSISKLQAKRDKSVVSFRRAIPSLFTGIQTDAQGKANSKIWQPLINVLTEIKQTHRPGRELLILFSDGIENSNGISLYKKHDLVKIEQQLVEQYGELPDANGIDILFIASRNSNNDEAVERAKKFWTYAFRDLSPQSLTFRANLIISTQN